MARDLRALGATRFVALADLTIFQFLLRSKGAGYFARNKLLPVVVAREVKFKRMLTFPRKYTIHTRMDYWDDEYFCWRQVFEEGGKYAAEIYTLGVILKRGTHEKFSPKQVAFDLLGKNLEPSPPKESVRHLMQRAKTRPELDDVLDEFEIER